MVHTNPRFWAAWITVGCVVLGAGAVLAQKPPSPQLQRIFDDWQKRQTRMKSVRYEVRGTRVQARGSAADDVTGKPLVPATPAHDISCPMSYTCLLDFEAGRYRLEEDFGAYELGKNALSRSVAIRTFDGKTMGEVFPREANGRSPSRPDPSTPDATVTTGNVNVAAFGVEYYPLFFAHGIVPTATTPVIPGPRMRIKPDPEMFYIQGRGRYQDRDCLVVRTHPLRRSKSQMDELWIDPARDSAVLRYIEYVNDLAWTDLEVAYQSTPSGWLPSGWTETTRVAKNRTLHVDHLQVAGITPEPAFEQSVFRVDIEPGMIISAAKIGGSPDSPLRGPVTEQTYYKIDPDGSWVPLAVETGRPPIDRGHYFWWIAGAVAFVALCLFAWRRRRHFVAGKAGWAKSAARIGDQNRPEG